MNKQEQGDCLLSLLDDIAPGLYLLDTDLSDKDIEQILCGLSKISYRKEELIPSKGGSPFELCVVGLCRQFECVELNSLRQLFLSTRGKQKENVRYDMLITICRLLCSGRKGILQLFGDIDLTSFAFEEIAHLKSAINHNTASTIILCKKKTDLTFEEFHGIKLLTLKNQYRMENKFKKVHITYKHNVKYQSGVDAIVKGLKKHEIDFSIDKYDILYRGDIQEYENEIGMSCRVIMFVIPEYLTSIDCMYEMTQIFSNGSINDRIFPLVDLNGISRNGDGLKMIKDYWQNEKTRKAEQIKNEPGGSKFLIEEIKKIDGIIKVLDDFWEYIVHKNTGSYNELIANEASLLINEIRKSLVPDINTSGFTPSDDTAPTVEKRVVFQGEKSVYFENNTGTININ